MSKDLYKRRVKEVMTRDVVTIDAQDTLHEALRLMTENRVAALPVVNGKGKCVGVISTSDLIEVTSEVDEELEELEHTGIAAQAWLLEQMGKSLGDRHVEDLMSRDVATVGPDSLIVEAARLMRKNRVHRLPVVEGDTLLGLISASDVLDAVAEGAPTGSAVT